MPRVPPHIRIANRRINAQLSSRPVIRQPAKTVETKAQPPQVPIIKRPTQIPRTNPPARPSTKTPLPPISAIQKNPKIHISIPSSTPSSNSSSPAYQPPRTHSERVDELEKMKRERIAKQREALAKRKGAIRDAHALHNKLVLEKEKQQNDKKKDQ